ncbi:uncharacterized protein Dwil_GK24784 [Drosophila willistoni]|uniref:F-box domain-containing protein n=1 Tax=Drosophila willistoni TaxID=7260 RepID=B4N078_DROWI|nr:uncharacterized protein LOC6644146 [Drosophila willistoni]EDW78013.1 uncharacterized protein Dwil_GK24784 [Drosophila willistoni]
MSAYNRKMQMLKKMSLGQLDSDMEMEDESGYLSFRATHNSTVEAPFLIDQEELENCQNVSNRGLGLSSTQYQTPGSGPMVGSSSHLWNKIKSCPMVIEHDKNLNCALESEFSTGEAREDETCKSPNCQQVHQASKRRKLHFQASHTSPKKSKKQLFPPPLEPDRIRRTRYYNGMEQLDIIGMLSNTLPAMQCILSNVNSQTLDVMTRVSKRWEQALYKIPAAVERLHNHRFKMNLTKENPYVAKRGRILSRSNTIVPLHTSTISNTHDKALAYENPIAKRPQDKEEENCHLVEQKQRIKCPRCGKGSKVYLRDVPSPGGGGDRSLLSQTLPNFRDRFASSSTAPPLARFLSLDLEEAKEEDAQPSSSSTYKFGECTNFLCRFRFCVHCYSQPHPGEKCLVTELGTPSKVMMPSERFTPPKQRPQNYNSKLSRKNSLKRLCF